MGPRDGAGDVRVYREAVAMCRRRVGCFIDIQEHGCRRVSSPSFLMILPRDATSAAVPRCLRYGN